MSLLPRISVCYNPSPTGADSLLVSAARSMQMRGKRDYPSASVLAATQHMG